jgi:phage N-6-adenine-methyltransferase
VSSQNTPTPVELVSAIESLYGITFKYDMAASEENHKAPEYFTEEDNSLETDWPTDGWCFLNPPFSNLGKWVEKCSEQVKKGCRIITIWPLSGDLNQIPTWQESDVNVVHGRVWTLVRGVMICRWDYSYSIRGHVRNLRWDKKQGVLIEL